MLSVALRGSGHDVPVDDERVSRLLSRVLRHAPESVGVQLDASGWADVPSLLAALGRSGVGVSRATLSRVVASSDKQRFELDETNDRVRARQGHSLSVDLGLHPTLPPDVLFHGTPVRNVAAIRASGLVRGERHHVHLSADADTALRVGLRRGPAIVLEVDAAAMAAAGHEFFVSTNGVWLTDAVPPQYVRPV